MAKVEKRERQSFAPVLSVGPEGSEVVLGNVQNKRAIARDYPQIWQQMRSFATPQVDHSNQIVTTSALNSDGNQVFKLTETFFVESK